MTVQNGILTELEWKNISETAPDSSILKMKCN